jgi:hypothetical protein
MIQQPEDLQKRAQRAYDVNATHFGGIRAIVDLVWETATAAGPCEHRAPTLTTGVRSATCSLVAGHDGAHTNGVLTWTERSTRPETPPVCLLSGGVCPGNRAGVPCTEHC